MLLSTSLLLAVAAFPSPVANAVPVPPCGSILVVNTIIGGLPTTCATPFAYQIGAPGITVSCGAAAPKVITGTGANLGFVNPGFANVTIRNCVMQKFFIGFDLLGVANNHLINDQALLNSGTGFNIFKVVFSTFTKDVATSNSGDGFNETYGVSNQYGGDVARSNLVNGFEFIGSTTTPTNDLVFSSTSVGNSASGFALTSTSGSTFVSDTANNNHLDGFFLRFGSNGNLLTSNTATINGVAGVAGAGFEIDSSGLNQVVNNVAKKNIAYGIHLDANTFQNKIFVNADNVNGLFDRIDNSGGPYTLGTNNFWGGNAPVWPIAHTFPAGLP